MAHAARGHSGVAHDGHGSVCRMARQGAAPGSAPAHPASPSCSTMTLGQRAASCPYSEGTVGSKMAMAVRTERLGGGRHQGRHLHTLPHPAVAPRHWGRGQRAAPVLRALLGARWPWRCVQKGSAGGGTRVGTCAPCLMQLQHCNVDVGAAMKCSAPAGIGQPGAMLILPNNTKVSEHAVF